MTSASRAAQPVGADRVSWLRNVPFIGTHVACLGALFVGVTWADVALCLALFWVRMFAITGGYHRYFSHRSYKTSRPFQLFLGVLGTLCVQKGPLWWAGNHRVHHKHSDEPGDIHSPRQRGLLWAHMGWIMSERHEATPLDKIQDFARYPELRWLNRWHLVPPLLGLALAYALGGWHAFFWGGIVSTVLLWHGTFTINSLSHVFGRRRYPTPDDSRNNVWLALLTLGEGWHNNHHHYQSSVRQGFFWWEIDVSYYVLRALAAVGLVWDLRQPPAHLLEGTADAVAPVALSALPATVEVRAAR